MDANNQMKLCDFGLAIDQKFEQANTRLGTFGYFAPEVLDCPLKKSPFDYKG
jgi:aurora kinase